MTRTGAVTAVRVTVRARGVPDGTAVRRVLVVLVLVALVPVAAGGSPVMPLRRCASAVHATAEAETRARAGRLDRDREAAGARGAIQAERVAPLDPISAGRDASAGGSGALAAARARINSKFRIQNSKSQWISLASTD